MKVVKNMIKLRPIKTQDELDRIVCQEGVRDDIKGLGYHMQFSNTGTSTKEFTDDRSVNETNQATVG